MMKLLAVAAAAALFGVGLTALGHADAESQHSALNRKDAQVAKIADARLKFEINATDLDGGIQVFLDADQWKRMSIFDPDGRRIFTTATDGVMAKQGGTELFLESAEPSFDDLPLDQLLERWPAGRYDFRGVGLNGVTLKGSALLTHDLPRGPVLVSPIEGGEVQNPDRTVVRWRTVPPPNGSPIIGYQVLVVEPDTGIRSLPKVTLDVMMPPTARRLKVPPGFLKPGTEYEWEVLAIERGGNQTLSSSTFVTSQRRLAERPAER
jgi:hypothetical protein